MIVCSCNVISRSDIEDAVETLLREDEWQLITVGLVYRVLEKRGQCCGCFPNAIGVITDKVRAWHRERDHADMIVVPFVRKIQQEHERCETARRIAALKGYKKSAA